MGSEMCIRDRTKTLKQSIGINLIRIIVLILMDFGSSFFVTQEKFNLFHRMDRELYKILVVSLFRDPAESMQVHAMWLWLERVGFRNVVKRVLALPNILINDVADETVMCLNCINSNNNNLKMSSLFSSESSEIPLLQSLDLLKNYNLIWWLKEEGRKRGRGGSNFKSLPLTN